MPGKDDAGKLIFEPDHAGKLTIDPPMYHWGCPKGHSWRSGEEGFRMMLHAPWFDQEEKSAPLCPYCVIDWLETTFPAENIGGQGVGEEDRG